MHSARSVGPVIPRCRRAERKTDSGSSALETNAEFCWRVCSCRRARMFILLGQIHVSAYFLIMFFFRLEEVLLAPNTDTCTPWLGSRPAHSDCLTRFTRPWAGRPCSPSTNEPKPGPRRGSTGSGAFGESSGGDAAMRVGPPRTEFVPFRESPESPHLRSPPWEDTTRRRPPGTRKRDPGRTYLGRRSRSQTSSLRSHWKQSVCGGRVRPGSVVLCHAAGNSTPYPHPCCRERHDFLNDILLERKLSAFKT